MEYSDKDVNNDINNDIIKIINKNKHNVCKLLCEIGNTSILDFILLSQNVELMKYLLKKQIITTNYITREKLSLCFAIMKYSPDPMNMYKELESYNLNFMKLDMHDVTLMHAMFSLDQYDKNLIQYLVSKGCDIHCVDASNHTPIHYAISFLENNGNIVAKLDAIKYLINNGAVVDELCYELAKNKKMYFNLSDF